MVQNLHPIIPGQAPVIQTIVRNGRQEGHFGFTVGAGQVKQVLNQEWFAADLMADGRGPGAVRIAVKHPLSVSNLPLSLRRMACSSVVIALRSTRAPGKKTG